MLSDLCFASHWIPLIRKFLNVTLQDITLSWNSFLLLYTFITIYFIVKKKAKLSEITRDSSRNCCRFAYAANCSLTLICLALIRPVTLVHAFVHCYTEGNGICRYFAIVKPVTYTLRVQPCAYIRSIALPRKKLNVLHVRTGGSGHVDILCISTQYN